MVTSDEVIKSFDKEIKTIPTNFNEKKVTCKTRFLYFTCLFSNRHYMIDSC